jgi:hypothetical protein
MATCSQNKYADSVNNLCQSVCPALNSLFGEPFARKCVTNCSTEGKSFLYADSLTRECTDVCSGTQFSDPTTMTCVSTTGCSSGLVSDPYLKKCVTRCYNETFAYQGSCYATCPLTSVYAN